MFAITERLLLRPGWAEDAPALARAIGDHQVVRNLSRVPWPYSLGDAERFLALPQNADRPTFLIFRREGRTQPELVGGIGLHDGANGEPNLGYWIAQAWWGHGYATEAGRAVLSIADEALRLPRVEACHALDNPASGAVLRKLGFRATGGTTRLPSFARGAEMEVRAYLRPRFAGTELVVCEDEPLAA